MKLLVIEDEREISESICQYFAGEDFLCETAFDYRAAIEMINLNEYVCILLDITLSAVRSFQLRTNVPGDCVSSTRRVKLFKKLFI
jgi:DNA-binding response OmpR family regulator